MSIVYFGGSIRLHGLNICTPSEERALRQACTNALYVAIQSFQSRIQLTGDVEIEFDEKAGDFDVCPPAKGETQ